MAQPHPEFDTVRDLIDAGQYREARALLDTLGEHPLVEKWRERIELSDPEALSPTERQAARVLARDRYLRAWMRAERRIARYSGVFLLGFALYLWQFETVFWLFSPDLLVRLLPLLVAAAGGYVIWSVADDVRLRRHILNMNPDDLNKVSLILLPTAGLLALLTLSMGNTAQFSMAAFLVVIGGLNLWRAARMRDFNRL